MSTEALLANDPTTRPFSCHFTPELPELIEKLGCSLLVSTYQAGKVIVLSSDGERIVQLPRSFDTPMGLAFDGERLAIATRATVELLASEPRLASRYPKQPGVYDSLFVPRSTHHCGSLLVHDLAWTDRGLVGVNTLFSCLFRLDASYSFESVWKPDFVSALAPEDRCHLNGLAVESGEPRFATALAPTDSPRGWRESREQSGVLLDVESGETVLDELPMPHSPRVYDGELYLLLSGTGELVHVDAARGERTVIAQLSGFLRGMTRVGDHLFVASSRIRKGHVLARGGEQRSTLCGITAVHLPTGAVVGELRYLRSCEEIYDVQALPGLRRPGLLGLGDPVHERSLVTADDAWWAHPGEEAP